LFGDIKVFTPAFVVVAGVAVFLGMPVYLAARAARNDTPIVAAVMGFVIGGAIPAILIFAGSGADQASVGDTPTIINGSFTLAGWLQSLGLVGLFGLVGVGGALVFWLIVRRSKSGGAANAESAPSRPLPTTLLSVTAAGVIAAAFAVPYVTADRSCHNPLRGGGTSIGEVASFDLGVGFDQWRNVEKEVDDFRRSGDWSVRNDVRTDESFPWLQISLCKEPGTDIFVQGFADLNVVSFGVYQPQGGSTWQPHFRALYERVSARWPTKITFRDSHGNPTTVPEWAASPAKQ
jgi:hypothetical protein